MQDYKDLIVWQKSMDFVDTAYDLTGQLPAKERYGLASQLQRASVSVPSNLAEGRSRRSPRDFARLVEIALGSAFECETLLLIVRKRYPDLTSAVEKALPQIRGDQEDGVFPGRVSYRLRLTA